MSFDPAQLAALSAILRLGSFDAAAQALNVTPSAVSQRLKALENRVGSALVIRGAPCGATATGARLARHADEVSVLEAGLARDIGLNTGAACLRVAVNADSLATWVIPALAAVPDVLFQVEVDDQDHSADWLRNGAVSAAVTGHAEPVQGCDSHALGALAYAPTASPGFFAKWFADGITVDTLQRAPCLTYSTKDRLQSDWMMRLTGQRLAPPTHLLPSTHAFVDAALAGMGWGMNPVALVKPHLDAGHLMLLDPAPYLTPLSWQIARHVADPLALLTRAIRAAAKEHLVRE